MAGRVKPRPPYDPNFVRNTGQPEPEKKPRKGLPPVSKKRAKENRQHDQIHDNFMRNNPYCDCGCGQPSEHRHHICSGTAGRDRSLFDTDTQLSVAAWCHSAVLDDLLAYPIERQVALKFAAILRKVNQYRGRAQTAITIRDVLKYLEID